MKIANLDTYLVRLPFKTSAPTRELGGRRWSTLDHVFVKLETDNGLVGWGDATAMSVRRKTACSTCRRGRAWVANRILM